MKQQRREDGAVALALDRVLPRRFEQLARLVIADRRRLAFAAFRPWPLDAFDRVMGDGVLLAQILEQRGERGQPVPDGRAAESALPQRVAPGDDVGARHGAKLLRPDDAGEAQKSSPRFHRRGGVLGLLRLANHSTSGGTSARQWNSAAVSSRSPGAMRVGSGSVMASGRSWGSTPVFLLFLIKSVIKSKCSERGRLGGRPVSLRDIKSASQ